MYIYILFACAVLSVLVFALPRGAKLPYTTALMTVVSALTLCLGAGVLAGWDGGWLLDVKLRRDIVFWHTDLSVDRLSAFFMIVLSVVAVSVAIYAKGYLKDYLHTKSSAHISTHLMSLVLMTVSIIFVVMSADAFSFLFAWELMTVTSFLLVLFNAERREVRRAAINYLILMHIGFVFLVVGFSVVSSWAGPLWEHKASLWEKVAFYAERNSPVPIFVVFLIGFGMKAGLFPMHTWMPDTYSASPSYVSGFMSGVVSKMGVYGVIRVLSCMEAELLTIGLILFVAGIVTGLWGALMAAMQNDMKRLLAYSSVENIGIIFAAMGAAAIGRSLGNDFVVLCAMAGALLHVVNHSMFKSLLFFGAGNVFTATRTMSLDALGGVGRRMPVTAVLFLVGAVAIAALPPLNGFVSEYMIYYGLLDAVGEDSGGIITAICGIVALALIGGIVVLAFTKLYGMVFLGSERSHAVEHAEEVCASRLVACAIPVAGILIVGLAPFLVTGGMFSLAGDVMGIGDTEVHYAAFNPDIMSLSIATGVFVATVAGLFFWRRAALRGRLREKTPVWGCGFTATNSRMQYTGESYSEGLYGTANSFSKAADPGAETVDRYEIFPSKHSFTVRHKDKVSTLFSQWWVEIVRRVNVRVMRYNTGKVNHYILYALSFLALIFLLSILNVI